MRRRLAFLLFGLATAGCGGPGTTTVTGSVSYQGRRLVCGNVTLVADTGASFAGDIRPDGTYTIADVPVGPVRIGVTSLDPGANPEAVGRTAGRGPVVVNAPKRSPAGGGVPSKVDGWFPIPDKYMHPAGSGLTGRAEPGQPLVVELK